MKLSVTIESIRSEELVIAPIAWSLFIDIAVFWLVFSLHGGTMAGGFSAMICAMLAGLVFPYMLKRG